MHGSAFAALGTLLSLHLSSPISANLAGLEPSQREQRIQLTLAFKLSYPSSHQFLYSPLFFSCFKLKPEREAKVSLDGQSAHAWSFLSYWPLVAAAPWGLGAVQGSTEIPQRSPYSSCTYFLLLWCCVVFQRPRDVHSLQKVDVNMFIFKIPADHQV